MKSYFEIKQGQHGFLNDGRDYQILSIPTITMCSDGMLKHGDVELKINGEYHKIRISEFVAKVKTIGNLVVTR